jgi:quinol monooxygenase YgiN
MNPEIEIVRIPVERARAPALVSAINSARAGYLAPPGCAGVELLVAIDSDEITAVVRWASAEAHEQAIKSAHSAAFFNAVMAVACGPPDVRKYEPAAGGLGG